MTTLLLKYFICFISSTMMGMKNPVKLSMILLMNSIMIFFYMYCQVGESWFPMLFSLIFMGGILMMFMILSSIMPNEKINKMKNLMLWVGSVLMVSIFQEKNVETSLSMCENKGMVECAMNFSLMVLILVFYFFSCVSILSKTELPMRSISCCNKS